MQALFLYNENHSIGSGSGKLKWCKGQKKSLCFRIKLRFANCRKKKQGEEIQMGLNDINSLLHTKVQFTRDYTG